jgi:hypothetical protein
MLFGMGGPTYITTRERNQQLTGATIRQGRSGLMIAKQFRLLRSRAQGWFVSCGTGPAGELVDQGERVMVAELERSQVLYCQDRSWTIRATRFTSPTVRAGIATEAEETIDLEILAVPGP